MYLSFIIIIILTHQNNSLISWRIIYVPPIYALSYCRNAKHFAELVNFTCVLSKGKVNQSKSKLIAVSAVYDKGPDFVCAFSSGSLRYCKYSAGHQDFFLKLMLKSHAEQYWDGDY